MRYKRSFSNRRDEYAVSILVLNHSGPGNLKKDDLVKLADDRDADGIKSKLREMVPDYMPFERKRVDDGEESWPKRVIGLTMRNFIW